MISYIKGKVVYISENYIIVENNNIGYNIQVSENTISKLSNIEDSIAKIYTYMNVKEDEISLFGFLSLNELEMFNKLISVSGVGPKGALSILSVMTPENIALAIITDDINALSKGQGIGKKTAQRLALELKDKVDAFTNIEFIENSETFISDVNTSGKDMNTEKQDAINGLVALGFGRSEAVKVAIEADDSLSSAEIIKISLKKLSSK